MIVEDELGLSFTASGDEGPVRFNAALEKYLASDAATMPAIEEAIQADPDMPMAQLFRAYLLKLAADPRFSQAIDECARTLAASANLNEREAMHRQALEAWRENRLDAAVRIFDDIVLRFPKDMLALRVAHYLHFYGEGGEAMLASISAAADQWRDGDRFLGYFRGMQCFALEESGRYTEAESAGREALEINPADVWAAHAVTHVMQMQGRFAEGIPFVESLKSNWSHVNNFVNHMHWHQALLHIGTGQPERALGIYDDLLVEPIKDDFYLDVCNAASLLWRLTMLGVDVGARWQDLVDISRHRVEDRELVFSTLHYLMAPTMLGDSETTNRCLASMKQWATSDDTQARVCRDVGQQLAAAVSLLGSDNPAEGARLLAEVQHHISRIGGSHAQRNLFDQLITHYTKQGTE